MGDVICLLFSTKHGSEEYVVFAIDETDKEEWRQKGFELISESTMNSNDFPDGFPFDYKMIRS